MPKPINVGHVIYVAACIIALAMVADFFWGLVAYALGWNVYSLAGRPYDLPQTAEEWLRVGGFACGFALLIWLAGRAVRYILAGR